MAALTTDRNTVSKLSLQLKSYPVAASTQIYKGGLVCVGSAGFLEMAADGAGNVCVGVAHENVNNTADGTGGALSCRVESGRAYSMAGSGLSQGDVGLTVYVVDDQTVSATPGANATKAGRLVEYDSATSGWIWIPIGGMQGGISTANANTQTGAYVQADVESIAALANAIKTALNANYL